MASVSGMADELSVIWKDAIMTIEVLSLDLHGGDVDVLVGSPVKIQTESLPIACAVCYR